MKRGIIISVLLVMANTAFCQDISGESKSYSFSIMPQKYIEPNMPFQEANTIKPVKGPATLKSFDEAVEIFGSYPTISVTPDFTVKGRRISKEIIPAVMMEGQNFQTSRKQEQFSIDVKLREGVNHFVLTVYTRSTEGRELNKEITITYIPQRKDYALIFANDNYRGGSYQILDHCIDDGKMLKDILESRFGFEVELKTDVTIDEMTTILKEYANKTYYDNDQLLVFFSGHGDLVSYGENKLGYFVGVNGKTLPHSEFRVMLDGIRCNHILLLADACFSATIKTRPGNIAGLIDDMTRDKPYEKFVADQFEMKTRKVIASGITQTKEISGMMKKVFDVLDSRELHYGKVISFYDLSIATDQAEDAEWGSFIESDKSDSDFLFILKPDN